MARKLGQYPNSGALFRNDKKTEAKHPDHHGDGEITCPHCKKSFVFQIGAWIKDAANGKKFFSFRFSFPPPPRPDAGPRPGQRPPPPGDF